jgi:hypothetical protein
MKQPFLTERGTIPALTDCAFRNQCEISAAGNCLQKGTAQGASVINLVTDPSMHSVVSKLPSAHRTIEFIDRFIAEELAAGYRVVDGFIELSFMRLMKRAEDAGLRDHDCQFILNALSHDAFSFGGRDVQNQWLDHHAVMSILRGVAKGEPAATQAAASITAVFRIAAYHPVEFSCAAARGFELVAS